MEAQMKAYTTLFTSTIAISLLMGIAPSFSDDSKPLIPLCPKMTEDNLQTLANDGKVSLAGQTYNLVTHQETHNNYNGQLIETKEKLTTFLNETKAKPTVTLNINSHQNPMKKDHQKSYCAYMLERESAVFVVALMPESEDSKK
jgi:hypothetical protein